MQPCRDHIALFSGNRAVARLALRCSDECYDKLYYKNVQRMYQKVIDLVCDAYRKHWGLPIKLSFGFTKFETFIDEPGAGVMVEFRIDEISDDELAEQEHKWKVIDMFDAIIDDILMQLDKKNVEYRIASDEDIYVLNAKIVVTRC